MGESKDLTYPWRDKPEDPDTSEEELTSHYETDTEPQELIMTNAMAGSMPKEETFSPETKMKLKTPMPY